MSDPVEMTVTKDGVTEQIKFYRINDRAWRVYVWAQRKRSVAGGLYKNWYVTMGRTFTSYNNALMYLKSQSWEILE